ncbi:MAG: SHOCT domain-containing protein [Mycobacterium sp.]|jgi:putative membrane protein|nr:SHOCT domain-containing protein [Mycobacterium sp.]
MVWSDHNMSGWGYAGMTVGMVLFWILVVVGIIALTRTGSGAARRGTGTPVVSAGPSPEQILAARFARGEIDDAEYHQRLDMLRLTAH